MQRLRRSSALLVSLGISVLLHVLVVFMTPAPPRQVTVRVFRRSAPRLRDLLAFRTAPPSLDVRPIGQLESPAPGAPSPSAIVAVPYSQLPGHRLPFAALGDSTYQVGAPLPQQPETPSELDLNQLALTALRRRLEDHDEYARLVLPDADTTDSSSGNRRRARMVIYKAIAAMGGIDALLAIRQMHAHVWILSSEDWRPGGIRAVVPVYTYPVSRWHFSKDGRGTREPVHVEISTDPQTPNPPYALRNPARELAAYDRYFRRQWAGVFTGLPSRLFTQRKAGRWARWHFLDRFLGAGVALTYLGSERYGQGYAHVVRVDDRQYGFYFEAFFDTETHLLRGTREGLSPWEQQLYRDRCRRTGRLPCRPPVWETRYSDYAEVDGVLTAHRLERQLSQSGRLDSRLLTVLLKVAYRADQLDDTAPEPP